MSEILLILVLHLIINETQKDLAKVQIKSEKLTSYEVFRLLNYLMPFNSKYRFQLWIEMRDEFKGKCIPLQ